MPKPGADPHGGIEDFRDLENPYKGTIPDQKKSGYTDEMIWWLCLLLTKNMLLHKKINNTYEKINMKHKEILGDLLEFFRQRFISYLEENSFDVDLVQAVAGETVDVGCLLTDTVDALVRVKLLANMPTDE